MAGGRRRRSRLLLLAILVAGLAAAAEGTVRLRQWMRYGTTGSFYEFVTDEATGLRIPAPGETRGNDRVIHVNSRGFRGPELELPKPGGRVRVAFLGGSTTFCAEASGEAATWPELVVAGLREAFPQREFDCVNAGAAGYTSRESLRNLAGRVLALQPDIVVVYHATNDLSKDSRELAQARGVVGLERPTDGWLTQHSLAWQILEKNLPHWLGGVGAQSGKTLECDFDELSLGFRSRLEQIVTTARGGGVRTVVLVTFAHRQRREQSPTERRAASVTSLYWMPYMTPEAIVDAFDAFNRAIAAAAAETGALLVGGEDAIPGDGEHFADSVHFTDAGCRLQARRVLDALLAPGPLDWLK